MENWNPATYQLFLESRTQPSKDLVNRIDVDAPNQIIDLGCGTGNSTSVCANRWRASRIIGIDSSNEMLTEARKSFPALEFRQQSIEQWLESKSAADIVFAAASLQWLSQHDVLFPELVERVNVGGVFAAHMPDYFSPAHVALRSLARSSKWASAFSPEAPEEWISHQPDQYYSWLAPLSGRLEIWRTDYFYPMLDSGEIVRWYESTGLRPYRKAFRDHTRWAEFIADFRTQLDFAFPIAATGERLFSIPRLFILWRR